MLIGQNGSVNWSRALALDPYCWDCFKQICFDIVMINSRDDRYVGFSSITKEGYSRQDAELAIIELVAEKKISFLPLGDGMFKVA